MADKAKHVILTCTVCLSRNYTTSRNKANATERLELMKFCKHCNQQTLHKKRSRRREDVKMVQSLRCIYRN